MQPQWPAFASSVTFELYEPSPGTFEVAVRYQMLESFLNQARDLKLPLDGTRRDLPAIPSGRIPWTQLQAYLTRPEAAAIDPVNVQSIVDLMNAP